MVIHTGWLVNRSKFTSSSKLPYLVVFWHLELTCKFCVSVLAVLVKIQKTFYTSYTKLCINMKKYFAVGLNSASIPVLEEKETWICLVFYGDKFRCSFKLLL